MATATPTRVNIHEAKSQLSRILAQVEAGEEVVVMRYGHPIAKIVPYVSDAPRRTFGLWKDQVTIAPDFDELPEEIAAAFEVDAA